MNNIENLKTKFEIFMKKVVYKIHGMDCDSCAKMIELDLEDGGFNCKCNFVNSTLEVETKNELDHKKIKEIVEKGGYKLAL